jgi:hypothetical protein
MKHSPSSQVVLKILRFRADAKREKSLQPIGCWYLEAKGISGPTLTPSSAGAATLPRPRNPPFRCVLPATRPRRLREPAFPDHSERATTGDSTKLTREIMKLEESSTPASDGRHLSLYPLHSFRNSSAAFVSVRNNGDHDNVATDLFVTDRRRARSLSRTNTW